MVIIFCISAVLSSLRKENGREFYKDSSTWKIPYYNHCVTTCRAFSYKAPSLFIHQSCVVGFTEIESEGQRGWGRTARVRANETEITGLKSSLLTPSSVLFLPKGAVYRAMFIYTEKSWTTVLVFQLNELDIQKIYINSKHCQEFEEFGLIDPGMKLSY